MKVKENRIEIIGFPDSIITQLNKAIHDAEEHHAGGIDFEVVIVAPTNGTITEPRVVITCFDGIYRIMLESIAEGFLKIILADLAFRDRRLEYTASCTFKAAKAVEQSTIQEAPLHLNDE